MEEENINSGVGLIVVDLQESLLSGISNKDELLKSVELLIRAIKLFEIPIVVSEQVPEKLGSTENIIRSALVDSKIFPKKSFSIFGSQSIRAEIEKLGLSHLILTGIESPICIYLSALDALKRGYEVTILSDCIGSRRMKDEKVAIDKLKDAGCHIIPMESFLYGFMTTSEHPNFREVSKLVRERNITKY